MNILLVEPDFPRGWKSKNHYKFMPIGLMKLATYYRKEKHAISIVRGKVNKSDLFFEHPNGILSKNQTPDLILITSYFTYWAKYVRQAVIYYKNLFPKVKIIVGGIYASLMPEHCKKYTKCDEVFVGIHEDAEKCKPSMSYIERYYGEKDYQILHTSRGCIRTCKFCGAYKIEPKFTYKTSIKDEITKKKLIFYDNNLLANPDIEKILTELAYLKQKQKISWCEAQSGLDGRILEKNHDLAHLLKEAGFRNIRISWDGSFNDHIAIKRQLDLIKKVGYNLTRSVFIFMVYNWDIPYEEMEKKRIKCWEWGVQISDCRYRPLTQTYDRYSGQKFREGQTGRAYHIHRTSGWTDSKIRTFRKHIRRQNICVRLGIRFYSNSIERAFLNKYVRDFLIDIAKHSQQQEQELLLKSLKVPYWFPENFDGNGLQMSKHDVFKEFEEITQKRALKGNSPTSEFKKWRNKIQREIVTKLL